MSVVGDAGVRAALRGSAAAPAPVPSLQLRPADPGGSDALLVADVP